MLTRSMDGKRRKLDDINDIEAEPETIDEDEDSVEVYDEGGKKTASWVTRPITIRHNPQQVEQWLEWRKPDYWARKRAEEKAKLTVEQEQVNSQVDGEGKDDHDHDDPHQYQEQVSSQVNGEGKDDHHHDDPHQYQEQVVVKSTSIPMIAIAIVKTEAVVGDGDGETGNEKVSSTNSPERNSEGVSPLKLPVFLPMVEQIELMDFKEFALRQHPELRFEWEYELYRRRRRRRRHPLLQTKGN